MNEHNRQDIIEFTFVMCKCSLKNTPHASIVHASDPNKIGLFAPVFSKEQARGTVGAMRKNSVSLSGVPSFVPIDSIEDVIDALPLPEEYWKTESITVSKNGKWRKGDCYKLFTHHRSASQEND